LPCLSDELRARQVPTPALSCPAGAPLQNIVISL
jgi:hypothetical protein